MTESKVGHRRRDLLRFAGVGAAAAVFGGCGGGGGDRSADESGGRSPSPSTAGRGGFPVTIDGVEGAITLDAAPTRVVSVGQYRDTDAAVALGVVPLATPNLDHFMQGGISPWVRERLTGEPPALFEFADGLPFEQLATFAPDLILATDHVNLDQDYETLTGIAPTLSTVSGYNRDPWQLTTARVGKALGRSDAATAAVAKVENAVKTARETNPGFAGKTFTIGPVQPDGTIFTINSAKDSSALFMAQLGLKLSPKLTGLPPGNFPGRATVSRERLDVLDADVMILTFNTPQARTRLEADPLFKRIHAVRRGAYIPLDLPTAIAMGFPTALSIPYALDRSVPKIAAALAV